MSTPEQPFEVPPEYAEVYERAYRRAYEEGHLSGNPLTGLASRPTSPQGERPAVPQQRTNRRRVPDQRRPPARAAEAAPAIRVDPRIGAASRQASEQHTAPAGQRAGRAAGQRTGHRADPRSGSTILPLVGLAALVVLLLVAAFLLGRVTAGTGSESRTSSAVGELGVSASGTEGPAPGPAITPAATSSYAGSLAGPS